MGKGKGKPKRNWKRVALITVLALVAVGALVAWQAYRLVYAPNISTDKPSVLFYIATGSDFDNVVTGLEADGLLMDRARFVLLAQLKKYDRNVRPGRYRLRKGMGNNELVNILRAGLQEPVKVTFNNIRLKEDFAARIGRLLETDSVAVMERLNDPSYSARYGLNPETILTMMVPNTYEMWWNTDADGFFDRMEKEHRLFWDADRIRKSQAQGLTPTEAVILAAIVERETNRESEKPTIAGVYLNRLRKGMALQADPTLVYANRDFDARRVLNWHKEIESPYNTYKYTGLPPGPICVPSPTSVDAVLSAPRHSYIYFCARPDGTGYHDFSVTFDQHLAFARAFQRNLNKRDIKR
jgi:UPF0755 protein